MTSKTKLLGLALAVSGLGLAAPVAAQQQQQQPTKTLKISKEAAPAVQKLQSAVTAGDYSSLPALVAAADATAKTADDRYAIASLRVRAAQAQKDTAALASALDALLATRRTVNRDGESHAVPAFYVSVQPVIPLSRPRPDRDVGRPRAADFE